MTPLEYYEKQIAEGVIEENTHQLVVVKELNRIFLELNSQKKWIHRIKKIFKAKSVKGLYLWGSVGTGKTHLVDAFYHCIDLKKIRQHFHPFMQTIHDQLNQLQGQKNPLQIIAKKLSVQYRVICFDEFLVSNIADAMLLGELLQHLFRYGVCLMATSNTKPDELYRNGLQRERFLPAIEAIKKNTHIYHLDSTIDYRLRYIKKAGVYYTPLDHRAKKNMEDSFHYFSQNAPVSTAPLILFGRPIPIKKQASDTIWFNFQVICGRPRSQKDYLAIAAQYRTVLVSDIPIIQERQHDLITSFIYLIDVLYDAHRYLVLSAEVPIHDLYQGKTKQAEFQRAQSRIIEMSSEKYLHSEVLQPFTLCPHKLVL